MKCYLEVFVGIQFHSHEGLGEVVDTEKVPEVTVRFVDSQLKELRKQSQMVFISQSKHPPPPRHSLLWLSEKVLSSSKNYFYKPYSLLFYYLYI